MFWQRDGSAELMRQEISAKAETKINLIQSHLSNSNRNNGTFVKLYPVLKLGPRYIERHFYPHIIATLKLSCWVLREPIMGKGDSSNFKTE